MSATFGNKVYIPTTTKVVIRYSITLSVVSGSVTVGLGSSNGRYTAVDTLNTSNTFVTFTNANQTQNVDVYLVTPDSLLTGTSITHTVTSPTNGSYTNGLVLTPNMTIADRETVILDGNGVTVKYTDSNVSDDLVGVLPSGVEYYVAPTMPSANSSNPLVNSIFYIANNAATNDLTKVVTTGVHDMTSLFNANTSFNQAIAGWDVSNVTNMSFMFYNTPFNQNINLWNVGNVTNMNFMFSNSPFNQDIRAWSVTNVTTMVETFGNGSFNQDIGAWDVSSVTNMNRMFTSSPFNQDIGAWDVGNVNIMSNMFLDNTVFNQDIGDWNTSEVRNFSNMFKNSSSFDQDISAWNVLNAGASGGVFGLSSNPNAMDDMFRNATVFNQNLHPWYVPNIFSKPATFNTGSNPGWAGIVLREPQWGVLPMVILGSGTPSNGTGVDGDYYIDYATNILFGLKNGGMWPPIGDLLPYDILNTSTVYYSPNDPDNAFGTNGDYYINTATESIFVKSGGVWQPGFDYGINKSGNIPPPNNIGNNGEYYVDTDTDLMYGPKTGPTWTGPGERIPRLIPTPSVVMIQSGAPTNGDGEDGYYYIDPVGRMQYGPKGSMTPGIWPAGVPFETFILTGTVDPTAGDGVDDEYYLNTTNDTLWGPKSGGTWPPAFEQLGQDVPDGSIVLLGSNPTNDDGRNGDYMIDPTGNISYGPKGTPNPGVWPPGIPFLSFNGSGEGPPDDNFGVDGDYYVDTLTDQLYGPKENGTWSGSLPISLPVDIPDGAIIHYGINPPNDGL